MCAIGRTRRPSVHGIACRGAGSGPTRPHTLSQPDSSILFEVSTVKSTSSKLRTPDSTLLRLVLFRRGENSSHKGDLPVLGFCAGTSDLPDLGQRKRTESAVRPGVD